MLRFIFFFLLISFPFIGLHAQGGGMAFGLKGGLTLGNQNWNGSDREMLPAYHGALFMETLNDSISLSLYGQLGYHVKGSAIRFPRFQNPITGTEIPARTMRYPFTQVSLAAGVKNRHDLGVFNGYYFIGLRLDYLLDYQVLNSNNNSSGFDQYVNKFTYGVSVGGGFEYEFSNFPAALFMEVSFHPDLSKQVFLPAGSVFYIDQSGQERAYPQSKVYNLPAEISIGVKFIRRVEWVDDWDESSLLKLHRKVAK